MTTLEFKTIAASKFQNVKTSELIEEVKKLATDFSDAAGLISEVIIDVLEARMETKAFIELCETL